MNRTRHPAEQSIGKLPPTEPLIARGRSLAEVCRVIEVTQLTVQRWRQQYGGMQAEEACWLTQLEKENRRHETLLAEAVLQKAMLKPNPSASVQPSPSEAFGSCRRNLSARSVVAPMT